MSKKTESIELRLSPELKAELAQRAQAENTTMSGYLRARIASDGSEGGTSPSTGAIPMTNTVTSRIALALLPVAAVAGVLTLTGTGAAVATPDVRVTFAEMDGNGDGTITQDEYRAYMADGLAIEPDMTGPDAIPAACAADLEGLLDPSSADLDKEAADGFAQVDFDKNGVVTFEELLGDYQRGMAEEFLAQDTNGDGYLTQPEVAALFSADLTETGADDADDGFDLSPACIAALTAEEAADDADAEALIAEAEGLSADDLELSAEDIQSEARTMIAEFDSNRDGKLSLAEFIGG